MLFFEWDLVFLEKGKDPCFGFFHSDIPFPRVPVKYMDFEKTRLREGLVAPDEVTDEWLFARVCSFVFHKVTSSRKRPFASFEVSDEWFFARVCAVVCRKAPRRCECTSTPIEVTDEGFFSSMCS